MAQTLFKKSQKGQHAYSLPASHSEFDRFSPPKELLRQSFLSLPEMSEIDLTRYFCDLSRKNVGIDNCFYPLGSCTMKFNPRINEVCAALPGFTRTHPLAPDDTVQGNLQIIVDLLEILCQLCGMKAGSLIPNAGAQGEFAGIRMIAEYHRKRKDLMRDEILIPDAAHGTNPATAAMAGFKMISIRTNAHGDLDLDHLRQVVSEKTAGLMMTNPNTLGLFSSAIQDIATVVHQHGGLLYYDGANLNPILHIARPGEMGFDVMHINLHKTFSTPHGGGGPGSGPILCQDNLKEFLPVPRVEKAGEQFIVKWNAEESIGNLASFYGNFAIYLRAYLYAKLHGQQGLRRIAELSVLNANYLKKRLSNVLKIPYPQPCMHEFVAQADAFLDRDVRALDIAKRLLDYGMYAPTIYFPLIVKECLLIEPTESESKATLDHFVDAVKKIIIEIETNPEIVRSAPHSTPIGRLDEVRAAKHPILKDPSIG
jgi:glycine dehydrogenase subunit 2